VPRLDRITLGKQAEDLACRELRRRGYEILARGYRTRMGEIDIVARDGTTVVFVEVKARRSNRCGAPAEAVTRWKQARIARLALDYLLRRGWLDRPCRFDVVGVLLPEKEAASVEIVTNAFDVAGR
jgi:putative endonuclease